MNIGLVRRDDFQRMYSPTPSVSSFSSYEPYQNSGSCVLPLVIIFIVIMLMAMSHHPTCQQRMQQVPGMVMTATSGMKTFIESKFNKVSAKQGTVVVDKYVKDAEGKAVNLTKCDSNDPKCNDFEKSIDPEFKKEKTEVCRKYLTENPNIFVLVYAPWCPHCHSAIPKFMTASNSMSSRVKPVIINAELVERELLHQMGVTHFPFMKMNGNVYRKAPEPEELVKFSQENEMSDEDLQKAKSAEDKTAETASDKNVVSSKAVTVKTATEAALDELF